VTAFFTRYGEGGATTDPRDLADLFEPGDSGALTGFVDSDGVDLGNKFAPVADGDPIGYPVGYVASDGRDLSEWFAAKGSALPPDYQILTPALLGGGPAIGYGAGSGTLSPLTLYGQWPVVMLAEGYYGANTVRIEFNVGQDVWLRGSSMFVAGQEFKFSEATYGGYYDDGENPPEIPYYQWAGRNLNLTVGVPVGVAYVFAEPVATGTMQAGLSGASVGYTQGTFGSYSPTAGDVAIAIRWNSGYSPPVSQAQYRETTGPTYMPKSYGVPIALSVNGGARGNVLPQTGSLHWDFYAPGNVWGLANGGSYSVNMRRAVYGQALELLVGQYNDGGTGNILYGFRLAAPAFGNRWVPPPVVSANLQVLAYYYDSIDQMTRIVVSLDCGATIIARFVGNANAQTLNFSGARDGGYGYDISGSTWGSLPSRVGQRITLSCAKPSEPA
jgi:hypothetical protein